MARSMAGGGFQKKNSAEEADLDITPMIDVTFLLLIFFMVTSTMQQESAVNVPPASFGVGKDASTSTIITILADKGGGPARVLLGDGSGEEARSMELVTAFVQQGLSMEGKRQVIIKADRDVNHGKVQEVLKALGEIEDLEFAVGVEEMQ